MFWILVTIVALIICYRKLKEPHSYWSKQGTIHSKPLFIVGNSLDFMLRTHSVPEMVQRYYNTSPNSRYHGMYQFHAPTLLLRDPELIKQITVKDFEYFIDRRGFVAEDSDPFFCRSLLSLTGQRWREMRSSVSPTFTSSKMKYIFSLVSQIGEQFVKHFLKQDKELISVEMRDIITKFANDVIANTVFGFDCDSMENPENEFYLKGQEATNFTELRKMLVFPGYMFMPKVFKFFQISMFSRGVNDFFGKVVKENIRSREDLKIVRPDMISLLLEARKNKLKHDDSPSLPDTGFAIIEESDIGKNQKYRKKDITDADITAQALTFFLAGFDSVSSLICFMSHELAVHPEIQERLIQEVDDTREQCNGKLTYEAIATMKYMDMVVSETLRKYPTAIATDRICSKAYTIEPKMPGEKPVHLRKGDLVMIPIYGLHRDPQYYPDPDRFDPERFSDENKSKITPYTYMPFGTGPRGCIGPRFALLEAKILFFYLLSNFEVVPVEKTQIPLKFNPKAINMSVEGFWLGLKRRVN